MIGSTGAGRRFRAAARGLALAVLGSALACLPLAACDSGGDAGAEGSLPPSGATLEVRPGVSADVYPPAAASGDPVPIVLLVPGGGWETADRTGLAPLAERLVAAGVLVVNTTYRAGRDGVTFPVPVQDVICAAGFAVAQAADRGLAEGPLVVVGHSAGGHLAALTALDDRSLAAAPSDDDPCPDDPPTVEGLVGLAGIYDAAAFRDNLMGFFDSQPDEDPDAWRSGDPVQLVDSAPAGLRVLLLHGDDDDLVPLSQSQTFEKALQDAGIPVELQVVPGADHARLYQADVVADPIIEWVSALADRQG